jgi:hypothetical protein
LFQLGYDNDDDYGLKIISKKKLDDMQIFQHYSYLNLINKKHDDNNNSSNNINISNKNNNDNKIYNLNNFLSILEKNCSFISNYFRMNNTKLINNNDANSNIEDKKKVRKICIIGDDLVGKSSFVWKLRFLYFFILYYYYYY